MSQSELAATLCDEVAELLRERSVMSCVFGSRLLLGLLQEAGLEASAIGVLLTISDPAASSGSIGRVAKIGDIDSPPENADHRGPTLRLDVPDGFPGHVVVLARADDSVVLLDPTAFQAIGMWRGALVSPPASSIVLRLGEAQTLALDAEVFAEHDGWIYQYSPQPHVDWRTRHEWVGVDRFRLDAVLRRRVTATTGFNFVLPSVQGRNEPCSCGSGNKYKRCCGRGA